jgi:hypothetical protein
MEREKLHKKTTGKINTKTVVFLALLIGMSAILSNIKIFETISFDSFPAFFAAMFISPLGGAIVASLGHLFTAYTSGFPLTVPIHIFIMFEMFIVVYLFGMIFKKTNAIMATLIAVVSNGPVSAIVSGWVVQKVVGGITAYKFFLLMVIPLTLATFVNVFLAYLVYRVMKNVNN